MQKFLRTIPFFALSLFAVSGAAISPTETVSLPTEAAYGGGDAPGSILVGATYNAGEGPGIWIVADGGYRLYHNGALLAEDNAAGRVRFIPMTFLPGENAISVVGKNGQGAPGILVQIDDLDKSYFSGSDWKAKPAVSNSAWKEKGRDLSAWGNATTLNYSNSKMPSGGTLSGFAANTSAKWIWTGSESDSLAVLLFTFYVKAEGFGASTTGGDAGKIVIASDSSTIRKYLQSSDAVTILVPEGTYDFRQFRNAVTEATAANRTWCKSSCGSRDINSSNTFYRIAFEANSCSSLGESGLSIVQESENLQSWGNWITVRANKSLIGMGRGANLRGASIANRSYEGAENNIYRNLAFYDVNPHLIEAGDGLDVVGSDSKYVQNFWADHISYKWISDGLDLENLTGATVSYLDYDGANEFNCYYYDPYMHLVQNAELTFANNYWHNSYGRVPKVSSDNRASNVHIYNSYVEYNYWHILDASGNSSYGSEVLYENNYIGEANIQVAGKDAYSKIKMQNNTVKKTNSKNPYSTASGSQSTPFSDNVFSPSYSYVLRVNSTLTDSIPKLSGVGGKFGSMPSYDQAFGQSNKAPSVSIKAPATADISESITLEASATDSDGKVSRVDFYVGNVLVGSATASPYQVTVNDFEPGTYSAVAVATDNSGLEQMSEFVTFTVSGTVYPEVKKCGAGSSKQSILFGEAITDFCYTWTGAETVSVEGFPAGILTDIDNSAKKVSISGTPTEAGEFSFTVSATNNDSTFVKSGKITVTAEDPTVIFRTTDFTQSTAKYRVFDMQGRPLYSGPNLPKSFSSRAIVLEFGQNGKLLKKYLYQSRGVSK